MSSGKAIGPISLLCLAIGVIGVLVMTIFMPAAELLPAQVYPAKRESGESPVRIPAAMEGFGKLGIQILDALPKPATITDANTKPEDVVSIWEANIIKDHGEAYGKKLISDIETGLGGRDNVKKIIEILHVDKNFVYSAYSLFLGLSLFAGAIAIQAVGRYGAEEKTVLPIKK